MMRSYIWSIISIIFIALFQSVVLSNILFLPAIPDLLLLTVLFFSFLNHSVFGTSIGFISGLILDFLSSAPIGLNALTKSITGFFTGKLSGKFNLNTFLFPSILAFFGTLLKFSLIFITSFFIKNIIYVYPITNKIFFYEIVMNIIFAPIIFGILKTLCPLFTINRV